MLAGVDEILSFWFAGAKESAEALRRQNAVWFGSDRDFDHEVRARFETTLELADTGACDHWTGEPRSHLALILLFDQFPRNIHRGTAQAFAYDDKALGLSLDGIDAGADQALDLLERVFFYMPLQHVESLEVQSRSVELNAALAEQAPEPLRDYMSEVLGYAVSHRDIIAQFGRFPHRNAVLGRDSTAEEQAYLDGGAARFGQ
ncbi:MAG: DUF924 family protein [Gammaproteobacteria bacterium]|nr:DUF924 family protein [Gammaproteobacteria bacterium]